MNAHLMDNWAKDESSRLRFVLKKILRKLGTPFCTQLSDHLQYEDRYYLYGPEIDPLLYEDSVVFSYDLFAREVLSKSSGFFIQADVETEGIRKFIEAELLCYQTNQRLYINKPEGDVEECLLSIRRKIVNVLGPEVPDYLSFCKPSWGPGSTKSISRQCTNAEKLGEYPFIISSSLWKLHSNYYSQFYPMLRSFGLPFDGPACALADSYHFDEVAKVLVVPKNSKVSRPITVEPTSNVNMTLVVGDFFRKRLKKHGIDLTCQETNQNLAKTALDNDLGTVDLSSASDCISLMLIQFLFPPEWADYILQLRTSCYHFVGQKEAIHTFEKFAGMGNGLTFPLETLIFYAIVHGVSDYLKSSKKFISLYGDDIICQSSDVPFLTKIMEYLGFKLNLKKTHYLPLDFYRESCGKQYFKSVNVTPVYIKEVGKDYDSCLRNHNRLFRWLVSVGRLDLVSILGSLRPKMQDFDPNTFVIGYDLEIPEHDHSFYLLRGETHYRTVRSKGRYRRVSSEIFMWWKLRTMEDSPSWNEVIRSQFLSNYQVFRKNKLIVRTVQKFELTSKEINKRASFSRGNYVFVLK